MHPAMKGIRPSGLCSLPDEVAVTCLAQLSRPDLAAIATTSKRYRSLVLSDELWDLRCDMSWLHPYLYVCLYISPEQKTRWFILHPLQRRLKPIHLYSHNELFVDATCSFVGFYGGIFIIGGLIHGKPTSVVTFLDCHLNESFPVRSMSVPRISPSAANFADEKIYVFGGCEDDVDSSKWAEVYDVKTNTWDFVSVTPYDIHEPAIVDRRTDEDKISMFVPSGKKDASKHGGTSDMFAMGSMIFCRANRGAKIFCCFVDELVWRKVKGLEEMQLHSLCGQPKPEVEYDITYLCQLGPRSFVIFWNTLPQGDPESVELWCAEISVELRDKREIWGKVEWSGAVFEHYSQSYIAYACPVWV